MNIARRRRNRSSADFQVCWVAGFQTRRAHSVAPPADWEIGDTAGLETCATLAGRLVLRKQAPDKLDDVRLSLRAVGFVFRE